LKSAELPRYCAPGYPQKQGRECEERRCAKFRSVSQDEENLMLTRTQHLFDDVTRVTAGDSVWQGRTSDDYWAFVGPFGGATAATILRALIDHPQRAGDPLSLTVNFCAPIAQGAFDLDVRLVKANRSTQHWSVELTQDSADVATLATAVFAERRPSWSHQQAEFPKAPRFEQILPYPKVAAPWVKQYDFRFAEGEPNFEGASRAATPNAFSKLWIGDRILRKIDMLSLMSMSDAFFGRVFHARRELVPFGTVSLTTYFHADSQDLAAEDINRVLAVADAKIFHKSYGDQTGELWSPNGHLLATTHQIAYFKA
jgi:acyl-CoA thioesterase